MRNSDVYVVNLDKDDIKYDAFGQSKIHDMGGSFNEMVFENDMIMDVVAGLHHVSQLPFRGS